MSDRERLLDELGKLGHGMVEAEHEVLDTVRRIPRFAHEHPPVRNVNQEFTESFTTLERVAIFITDRVGTFGFFLIVFTWSVLWLGWNTLGPRDLRFDAAPAFVLWLFISNLIQITLMPLIMVGQNLQGRHAELRAQSDYEVNLKAEKEVEVILLHLEKQSELIERQGELILDILNRLSAARGITPAPARDGDEQE